MRWRASITGGFAQGFSIFLGGIILLNLLGDLLRPGFNTNLWWIDLRSLPAWLAASYLSAFAMLLVLHAIRPAKRGFRQWATAGLIVPAVGWTLLDAAAFVSLLAQGRVHSTFPVPFSILAASGLLIVLLDLFRKPDQEKRLHGRWAVAAATVVLLCILAPLAQMVCFGKTDYRRPADAVVVFGCKVHEDGRLSNALADRVATGSRLCREGLARYLILSGGPGTGNIHETEAMRRAALEQEVPAEAILCDRKGVNTEATVHNTVELFREMGIDRVMAVSHFYHLPRIKMAYQRAGFDVFTVPAEETYLLKWMPYYMAREVCALWLYYLRPILGD